MNLDLSDHTLKTFSKIHNFFYLFERSTPTCRKKTTFHTSLHLLKTANILTLDEFCYPKEFNSRRILLLRKNVHKCLELKQKSMHYWRGLIPTTTRSHPKTSFTHCINCRLDRRDVLKEWIFHDHT